MKDTLDSFFENRPSSILRIEDQQLREEDRKTVNGGARIEPSSSYVTCHFRSLVLDVEISDEVPLVFVLAHLFVKGATGVSEYFSTIGPDELTVASHDNETAMVSVQMEKRLLGPIPYNGEEIEIRLGVYSTKGNGFARQLLELLSLAEVSGVSSIDSPDAELVEKTMQLIIESGHEIKTHLCTTLDVPRDQLEQGWYLVCDKSVTQSETTKLMVAERDSPSTWEGYPYFLLSVESSAVRDDWCALPEIQRAWTDLQTVFEQGQDDQIQKSLNYFERVVVSSKQLLPSDARRLIEKVTEHVEGYYPGTEVSEKASEVEFGPLQNLGLFEDSDPTAFAPRLFPVWFGTNRKPRNKSDLTKGFSGLRDTKVHYGKCQVSVPRAHRFGEIGNNFLSRWLRLEFGDDRLKVESRSIMNENDFWKSATSELAARDQGERRVLIYLHGFNNSFDDAAIRAAQLGFDLRCSGLTAFYSWPSRGEGKKYVADEAAISGSEGMIAEFISKFATQCSADRVDLIAHSMGNRGLLRSIQRICSATKNLSFGQIILAAPDVDVDLFKEVATQYQAVATRTTLYVSPSDHWIELSEWLHDAPRVGLSPPVTIVDGIDTIEVKQGNIVAGGHNYFSNLLLTDIFDLFTNNADPDKRQRPIAKIKNGEKYWVIEQ